MKKGSIYCLICPISKKPKYVGQTIRNLNIRLKEHKSFRKDKSHKNYWINLLIKNNKIEDLTIHLLGEYIIDDLNKMETYWINFFNIQNIKLTNTCLIGGHDGYAAYTKELNEKRAKKLTGTTRIVSDDTRKKIYLSLIGKPGRNTGNKHTEETKAKIKKTKTGSIPPNRKEINQYDKNNIYIKTFLSVHHAAKELNINQGNISEVANGKRKYCGGFIWKFKN